MYLYQGKYTGKNALLHCFLWHFQRYNSFLSSGQKKLNFSNPIRKSNLLPFILWKFVLYLSLSHLLLLENQYKTKAQLIKFYAVAQLNYSHIVQMETFVTTREVINNMWIPKGLAFHQINHHECKGFVLNFPSWHLFHCRNFNAHMLI